MKIFVFVLLTLSSSGAIASELCKTKFYYGTQGYKLFRSFANKDNTKTVQDRLQNPRKIEAMRFENYTLTRPQKFYDKECSKWQMTDKASRMTLCYYDKDSRYTKCKVSCGLVTWSDCDYY